MYWLGHGRITCMSGQYLSSAVTGHYRDHVAGLQHCMPHLMAPVLFQLFWQGSEGLLVRHTGLHTGSTKGLKHACRDVRSPLSSSQDTGQPKSPYS